MKIVTIYSNSSNSGRKSLAMALGQQAAKQDKKTLLIEMDYINPGIAKTYGITNSEKNAERFFEQMFIKGDFKIDNFIMKKKDFEKQTKDLTKAHSEFNSALEFLTFSQIYNSKLFPNVSDLTTEQVYNKITRLNEELRESHYDLIIQILPTDYEDMFSVPLMLESDHVINVVNFSLSRIEEMKSISQLFDSETLEKMLYVLNFTTKKIDKADYDHLFRPLKVTQLIHYDEQRAINEINAEIGSPAIDSSAIQLLKACDIEIVETKRSFFIR